MKYFISTIILFVISVSSFSQVGYWGFNYGETYSFGTELYQHNAKLNYISTDSQNPLDTTFNHNYTSLLPHIKLHYDIASIAEDDIIYFNFTYGISINLSYRVNGERSTDNFPISHFIETGLTYLKGDEYGQAYLGTISLTFLPAFNTGELFLGPTACVGYQFEFDERLIQVYAKGGFGLLGNIERNDDIYIDGNGYDIISTYNSTIFGIGVVYRGLN